VVGRKGTIATELRTSLLRVKETQSFFNRDWVRPGLHGILHVRADACLPMFTQFSSPLRQETACWSHDYQVTLRLPLHTFPGPGATPYGQVLLSDRLRQTLLTTALVVVLAIIYDRVIEAGIYINLCALSLNL